MDSQRDQQAIDANEALRQVYEEGEPTETEAYRDGTEPVSSADQLAGKPERTDDRITRLSGGDVDAAAQDLEAGIETPGGSNPTPDQDQVDAIGASAGVTYQDNEPLKFGDKMAERDDHRWELDPASSEDYQERQETPRSAEETRPRRPSEDEASGSAAPKKGTTRGLQRKTTRRPKKTTRPSKTATTQSKRGTRPSRSRKQAAKVGLKRSGVDVSRKRSSKSGSRAGGKRTGKRSRS